MNDSEDDEVHNISSRSSSNNDQKEVGEEGGRHTHMRCVLVVLLPPGTKTSCVFLQLFWLWKTQDPGPNIECLDERSQENN